MRPPKHCLRSFANRFLPGRAKEPTSALAFPTKAKRLCRHIERRLAHRPDTRASSTGRSGSPLAPQPETRRVAAYLKLQPVDSCPVFPSFLEGFPEIAQPKTDALFPRGHWASEEGPFTHRLLDFRSLCWELCNPSCSDAIVNVRASKATSMLQMPTRASVAKGIGH